MHICGLESMVGLLWHSTVENVNSVDFHHEEGQQNKNDG